MLNDIKRSSSYYIFSFFVMSMGMWFMEILYSLIIRSKLVNPGALFGPWCPIYGTGFLFCMLLVNKKDNRIFNFLKIFLILTLVEYITSCIIGYIFNNAIWDYSNYPFNVNGRVCLHMSIIFAVTGYITIYIFEPIIRKMYIKINKKAKIITYTILTLFIFDIIASCFL